MRAVVQRCLAGEVSVDDEVVASLASPGLVVLVGVGRDDTAASARALAAKLWHLRILADEAGRMNVSAAEVNAPFLVVSQFTLYGDATRGRRPSFVAAMAGEEAEPVVSEVVSELRRLGAVVETGVFGAEMRLSLVNDGPVTLIIES